MVGFDFRHQILYHDELVRNIRKNMKFFETQPWSPPVPSTTSLIRVMRRRSADHFLAGRLCGHDASEHPGLPALW